MNRENGVYPLTWDFENIIEQPPVTWEQVFSKRANELRDIAETLNFLNVSDRCFSHVSDIFKPFHYTPLPEVKVVIMKSEPYPMGNNNGLAYSSNNVVIPPSLRNIYQELAKTVAGFKIPDHGNLSQWAFQGVLLLNMSLTKDLNSTVSHVNLWWHFIKEVILAIVEINPKCIFVLWGRDVGKIAPFIGPKCYVLEASHPSPLTATRGFFGCNHFKCINHLLKKQGKSKIDWTIGSLGEVQQATDNYLSRKSESPIDLT